jgi:phosphate transport system ATP-binding protein
MSATLSKPQPVIDASGVVPDERTHVRLDGLSPYYGAKMAVWPVELRIPRRQITAIIGPSGCGKSTVLRSINRMHETAAGATVKGSVWVDGYDVYAPTIDPTDVRRHIGMVFQQPNPLRARSIFDNVAAGLELEGVGRAERARVAEESLQKAALWDEVKDRLNKPGVSLSGGQQQRLCIARTLAVQPSVILMDEPCSALDPLATLRIEDLLRELARDYTIVIVTHNMQQAARVSDLTVFMTLGAEAAGEIVEVGATREVFTKPSDRRTEDYITGRMG